MFSLILIICIHSLWAWQLWSFKSLYIRIICLLWSVSHFCVVPCINLNPSGGKRHIYGTLSVRTPSTATTRARRDQQNWFVLWFLRPLFRSICDNRAPALSCPLLASLVSEATTIVESITLRVCVWQYLTLSVLAYLTTTIQTTSKRYLPAKLKCSHYNWSLKGETFSPSNGKFVCQSFHSFPFFSNLEWPRFHLSRLSIFFHCSFPFSLCQHQASGWIVLTFATTALLPWSSIFTFINSFFLYLLFLY